MKQTSKFLFSVALLGMLSASMLYAQDDTYAGQNDEYTGARVFKRFKVGVGLPFTGVALGFGTEIKDREVTTFRSGTLAFSLLYVEPQYAITDNIGVGLRLEGFMHIGGSVSLKDASGNNPGAIISPRVAVQYAFLATADYYLTKTKARPSFGLGLGYYLEDSGEISFKSGEDNLDQDVKTGTSGAFGVMPRFRLNIGHFVMGLSYHLALNKAVSNNLAFNLGWEFGGGRRIKG